YEHIDARTGEHEPGHAHHFIGFDRGRAHAVRDFGCKAVATARSQIAPQDRFALGYRVNQNFACNVFLLLHQALEWRTLRPPDLSEIFSSDWSSWLQGHCGRDDWPSLRAASLLASNAKIKE